jgi:hypothetical protein
MRRSHPASIGSKCRARHSGSSEIVSIEYALSYRDLSADAQQSHIHFGRRALPGASCSSYAPTSPPPAGVPTPPPCPLLSGTVQGTLTAADVIARANQGIDNGADGLAEMIKAVRARAAYAKVHSANFPTGEIRGTIKAGEQDEDGYVDSRIDSGSA